MGWCPKCKYEYKEGIKVCADCGSELVDDLSLVLDKNDEIEDIDPNDLIALAESFELTMDEEDYTDIPNVEHINKSGVYVNNQEKAEENKTSAFTLISVGVIGLVLIALFFFDILPINLPKFNKYMITGVMGAMFLLFFVMGLVSLRNFKVFKNNASTENRLSDEIKNWCKNNFNKETVDSKFDFKDEPDEIRYFQRFKYIKDNINSQFMNLDEAYVDRLVDEIYSDIFE